MRWAGKFEPARLGRNKAVSAVIREHFGLPVAIWFTIGEAGDHLLGAVPDITAARNRMRRWIGHRRTIRMAIMFWRQDDRIDQQQP